MLHIKCRPNNWNSVIGNKDIVQYLRSSTDNPDRPHAYLFTGPSGCGKTTLARIYAQEIGSSGSDLTEIDVGDFRGIDTIRDIRQTMVMSPMVSSKRVWILDEVHRLTGDAQAALLKALEDAPKTAYFILCTTDPQKLLGTIINRCTPVRVFPLTDDEMLKLLGRILRTIGNAIVKQEILLEIVDVAKGCPRQALVTLEKHITNPEAPIASLGMESKEIIDLCRALLKKQSWRQVVKILGDLKGQDVEEIRRAVLGYAAAVMMKGQDDPQALVLLDVFKDPFYNSGWPGVVWACAVCVQKG